MALYNKYRPMKFSDVLSQDLITGTLINQIMTGRTAHAYLFTGSRGTGKTTLARIFAKSLCCTDSSGGEPCGKCQNCVDAENGALTDISEIDAASNNSVDDVRELRDLALYTPERAKYKIYIIDEVHMLSTSAFNALLKILEEPPAYVKFILATTEVHKVMQTILSRVQRFDFRRITIEDIKKRLLYVSELEKINLEDAAAEYIAYLSDGGMRDALSILDRLAGNDVITVDAVAEGSGLMGRKQLFELMSAIADGNSKAAVSTIRELHSKSKDMVRICEELTMQFRNVMMMYMDKSLIQGIMPGEDVILSEIAGKISLNDVLRILDNIGQTHNNLFKNVNKVVETEMCVIKCCFRNVQPQSVPFGTQNMTQSVPFATQNVPQSVPFGTQNMPNNIPNNTLPVVSQNQRTNTQNTPNTTQNIPQNTQNIPFEKLGTPTKNENILKLSDGLTAQILGRIKSKLPHIAGNIKPYISKSGEMLIYTNSKAFADFIKDAKFGYIEDIHRIVKEVLAIDFRIKIRYVEENEHVPQQTMGGGNVPQQTMGAGNVAHGGYSQNSSFMQNVGGENVPMQNSTHMQGSSPQQNVGGENVLTQNSTPIQTSQTENVPTQGENNQNININDILTRAIDGGVKVI
jgi:DNA polymerase-3 subunit gamma/tau